MHGMPWLVMPAIVYATPISLIPLRRPVVPGIVATNPIPGVLHGKHMNEISILRIPRAIADRIQATLEIALALWNYQSGIAHRCAAC